MKLQRYWIEFDINLADWTGPYSCLRAGCGVTGFGLDDCLNIIQDRMTRGQPLPTVKRVLEDVDVSRLDPRHVLPNMGMPTERGIWFPLGYDQDLRHDLPWGRSC